MIGGSAVGVELGQFLARMGTQVTLVQRGPRLLSREDPASATWSPTASAATASTCDWAARPLPPAAMAVTPSSNSTTAARSAPT